MQTEAVYLVLVVNTAAVSWRGRAEKSRNITHKFEHESKPTAEDIARI